MNDTSYMDNSNSNGGNDVLVALESTGMSGIGQSDMHSKGVSATTRLSVADTRRAVPFYVKVALFVIGFLLVFGILKISTNAAESSVYVDSTYMQEQFGAYKNYAILTDGQGNYATIFSDSQIISTGTTIHSLLTNGYYGFKTMKLEDDYLVIDENGKSYNAWSSVTVQLNSLNIGYTSSINQFVWSNVDIYKTVFSNMGSPSASNEVLYSVANNIGSKPIEEPTEPTPSITVDCKFTDEKIIEKLDVMQTEFVAKCDILIMLLIMIIALKMFSPLANNRKRGLEKKEK